MFKRDIRDFGINVKSQKDERLQLFKKCKYPNFIDLKFVNLAKGIKQKRLKNLESQKDLIESEITITRQDLALVTDDKSYLQENLDDEEYSNNSGNVKVLL